MTLPIQICVRFLVLASAAVAAVSAEAVGTIWNGPRITFTKEADEDPDSWMLAENQDRITDNVWITRGLTRGIFNAAVEGFPPSNIASVGPAGTEWAVGTTADLESLTFDNWRNAVGNFPPGAVGTDYVVHLIEDDIYLDLRFLEWGQGQLGGGSFSYSRTTVPEPAAIGLLGVAGVALAPRRRRR